MTIRSPHHLIRLRGALFALFAGLTALALVAMGTTLSLFSSTQPASTGAIAGASSFSYPLAFSQGVHGTYQVSVPSSTTLNYSICGAGGGGGGGGGTSGTGGTGGRGECLTGTITSGPTTTSLNVVVGQGGGAGGSGTGGTGGTGSWTGGSASSVGSAYGGGGGGGATGIYASTVTSPLVVAGGGGGGSGGGGVGDAGTAAAAGTTGGDAGDGANTTVGTAGTKGAGGGAQDGSCSGTKAVGGTHGSGGGAGGAGPTGNTPVNGGTAGAGGNSATGCPTIGTDGSAGSAGGVNNVTPVGTGGAGGAAGVGGGGSGGGGGGGGGGFDGGSGGGGGGSGATTAAGGSGGSGGGGSTFKAASGVTIATHALASTGSGAAGTGGSSSAATAGADGSVTIYTSMAPLFANVPTSYSTPQGTAFNFAVMATGTPAPTITKTGSLPTGLSFTNNVAGTATFSGTASLSAGTYPFTLTASNGVGTNATQSFTLLVTDAAAPTITSAVLADSNANEAGYISGTDTYFAYANVSAPSGGSVGSVQANLSAQTTGGSAVVLTTAGGPFTVLNPDGSTTSFSYRSSSQASVASPGTSFSITATSGAPAHSSVFNGTTAIDAAGNPQALGAISLVTSHKQTTATTCPVTANAWVTSQDQSNEEIDITPGGNSAVGDVMKLTVTDSSTATHVYYKVVQTAGATPVAFTALDFSSFPEGAISAGANEYTPGGNGAVTKGSAALGSGKDTVAPTVTLGNLTYVQKAGATADQISGVNGTGPNSGFIVFNQTVPSSSGPYNGTLNGTGALAALNVAAVAGSVGSPITVTYNVVTIDLACNSSTTATFTASDNS